MDKYTRKELNDLESNPGQFAGFKDSLQEMGQDLIYEPIKDERTFWGAYNSGSLNTDYLRHFWNEYLGISNFKEIVDIGNPKELEMVLTHNLRELVVSMVKSIMVHQNDMGRILTIDEMGTVIKGIVVSHADDLY
jgi:hypothetical protein